MKRPNKYSSELGASTFQYVLLLSTVVLAVVWAFGPNRVVSLFVEDNMVMAADSIGGSTIGTTQSGAEIPLTNECPPTDPLTPGDISPSGCSAIIVIADP